MAKEQKKSILDKYPSVKNREVENVKRFSSQSIAIDKALGGGYPRGRVIEVYGPESSGKTTICLHAIAELNRNKERVAYVDTEHSYEPIYAESIGVVPELFHLVQPDSAEDALQTMVAMAESGEFSAIVLDSVAALVPTAELNGEVGDSTIGLVARLMNQTLRKITGPASKTETTIFFINQLRDRVGVMYGSPETTTGGKGLKFYASIRLDVRRQIDRDKPTDNVKVKVVKNKVAPPFGLAEFKVRYGVGIDRVNEILNECVLAGIIQKSGSWFSYGDTKLGQGEDSVSDLLRDNPELFEELKTNLTSD